MATAGAGHRPRMVKGINDRPGSPTLADFMAGVRGQRAAAPGSQRPRPLGDVPGLEARAPQRGAADASMAPRSAVPGKRPRADSAAVSAAATVAGTDTAPPKRNKMTAGLIARVLELKAQDPNRSVCSIANGLGGADYKQVNKHLDPRGTPRKPQTLMALADYTLHEASIGASLQSLGHPAVSAMPAAEGGSSHERLALTAKAVCESLQNRVQSGKHVGPESMRRWAQATAWEKDKLADRLARMPDYADHRADIEPLLKTLGVIGPQEKVPEPQKSRDSFDARMLVAALRLTLQRAQARAEGTTQGNDPRLARHVHESLGISRLTLGSWMYADGRLRKSPNNVSRLPGYVQVHEEIKDLLRALGHAEMADELPADSKRRIDMRAELIARTLAMMVEDPRQRPGAIAPRMGLSDKVLKEYIGTDGTSLDFGRIAALADYAAQVDSIRDSLRSLGRDDVAQGLPAPPAQVVLLSGEASQARVPVMNFLSAAENQTGRIAEAAVLLRDNPTMGMDTAMGLAGVSKPVARLLIDERGRVRDAGSIEAQFDGMDTQVSARLARLVDRLWQRVVETEPASAGPMKPLQLRGRDRRMLIVDHRTKEPAVGAPDQLKSIYAQNASLVQEPRSYATDRQRQPLRWLSTVLKQRFPQGLEVQCHFEPRDRVIVVSSNSAQVNADLQDFLKDGGLHALLREQPPSAAASQQQTREERHLAKLATRMNRHADPHRQPESDAVFQAIAEGRFRVPLRQYGAGGPMEFLHAERRIKDYLHEELHAPLQLEQLAGTMRPCGTCAEELGAGPDQHRGPFWMSKASRPGVKGHEDIDRHVSEGLGTSVTMSRRDGRLTFGHDTDSDSDG
jgi:hypothetical protein